MSGIPSVVSDLRGRPRGHRQIWRRLSVRDDRWPGTVAAGSGHTRRLARKRPAPGGDAGPIGRSCGPGATSCAPSCRRRRRRPTLTLCMTVAERGADAGSRRASVSQRRRRDRASASTAVPATRHAPSRSGSHTLLRCSTESSPPDFPRMRNRAMALVETDWAIVLDGHEWIRACRPHPGGARDEAWSIEIETLYEPDEQRVPGPSRSLSRASIVDMCGSRGAAAHEEITTPWARRSRAPTSKSGTSGSLGTRRDSAAPRSPAPNCSAAARPGQSAAMPARCSTSPMACGRRAATTRPSPPTSHTCASPHFADEAQPAAAVSRPVAVRRRRLAVRAGRPVRAGVLARPERAEPLVGLGHALLAPRRCASGGRLVPHGHGPCRNRRAAGCSSRCRCTAGARGTGWRWRFIGLADYFGSGRRRDARRGTRGRESWASSNVAWWRARAAGCGRRGSTAR